MTDAADPAGPTDAALVRRLRAGDAAAFDAVYARYSTRVYGFLARLTGRRDAADDLAQETWLRFARHAATLRDDARLGPWLFAVARNLALSHRRRASLDDASVGALGWSAPAPDAVDAVSPFTIAAASELEDRLEAALAALPEKYREVVLLVGLEGLAPQDVAAILKLAPDAVRQRLARARAMVADFLARAPRGGGGGVNHSARGASAET